ncbi:MAG TPA: hypothetical protein VMT89_11515 [Candidatus Acidoferrales bacterium]|nr:hypothetical protein [Candidatus Acidoferrales bacterium]
MPQAASQGLIAPEITWPPRSLQALGEVTFAPPNLEQQTIGLCTLPHTDELAQFTALLRWFSSQPAARNVVNCLRTQPMNFPWFRKPSQGHA